MQFLRVKGDESRFGSIFQRGKDEFGHKRWGWNVFDMSVGASVESSGVASSEAAAKRACEKAFNALCDRRRAAKGGGA